MPWGYKAQPNVSSGGVSGGWWGGGCGFFVLDWLLDSVFCLDGRFIWLQERFIWVQEWFIWLNGAGIWLNRRIIWVQERFIWLNGRFIWLDESGFGAGRGVLGSWGYSLPTHSGPSGCQVIPGRSGGGVVVLWGVRMIFRLESRAWRILGSVRVAMRSTFF